MKIGVDIDGCLSVPGNQSFFRELAEKHEVHLLTARSYMHVGETVFQIKNIFGNLPYTSLNFFMEGDELEKQDLSTTVNVWVLPPQDYLFVRAKGLIAQEMGLEKFYDDWAEFLAFMPEQVECMLVQDTDMSPFPWSERELLQKEIQKHRRFKNMPGGNGGSMLTGM